MNILYLLIIIIALSKRNAFWAVGGWEWSLEKGYQNQNVQRNAW